MVRPLVEAYETKVPTFVTDPLIINGEYAKGRFRLPLAKGETPLAAGVNRGVKALNQSRGVDVRIIEDYGMSRAGVFKTPSIDDLLKAYRYIKLHKEDLAELANSTTRYGKVKSIRTLVTYPFLHLRINMLTGDAAGHNMTTKATDVACDYLEKKLAGLEYISVSGNMCDDKNSAAINFIEGRGKELVATAKISNDVCIHVLGAHPEKIYEVFMAKTLGSIRAGSLGANNAHYGNIIDAIYTATGQDTANVIEGSHGINHLEIKDDSVYFSITLPNVIVGTLGGNILVKKSTRDTLRELGCYGSGTPIGSNASKLAEIVGAGVFVGEFNLLAEESKPRTFVRKHIALERAK